MTLISSKMIAWLIAIPAALVALLFGSFVAKESYIPILAFALAAGLFIVYFSFGKKLWVLLPVGLAIKFSANFLPLNFSYTELITGLAIALFIFQYQAIEKRTLKFGPIYIWLPLFSIIAILLVQMFSEGVGFRVLGNAGYGARKYLPAFFGLAAYILILTSPNRDWKTLNRIPIYFLVASILGIIPSLITTVFPGATPVMFLLFGSANVAAYMMSTGESDSSQLVRYSEFAILGIALVLCLVSYFPIQTWWRPKRWWVTLAALISTIFVFFSGFRNNVLTLFLVFSTASTLSLSFIRTLLLGIPAVAVLLVVAAGHGNLYSLPYTIQRTLSMLPGDWDPDVLQDSNSSNSFRSEVQEIYLTNYFHWTAWGNGFKFDPADADASLLQGGVATPETFVIKKDFHIGWISLYDAVGIIGTLLIAWIIIAIAVILVKLSKVEKYRKSPIFIWISCYLVSTIISYFTVFGSFPTLMSQLGTLIAILLSLMPKYNEDLQDESNIAPDAVTQVPFAPQTDSSPRK